MHGTEKDIPALELPLAIARGRAASSAQALASEAQANRCLDGRGYGRALLNEGSQQASASPERIDAGNFADTPLHGRGSRRPRKVLRSWFELLRLQSVRHSLSSP